MNSARGFHKDGALMGVRVEFLEGWGQEVPAGHACFHVKNPGRNQFFKKQGQKLKILKGWTSLFLKGVGRLAR